MKVSLDWKGSFGGVEVGIVKCKACAIFVLLFDGFGGDDVL